MIYSGARLFVLRCWATKTLLDAVFVFEVFGDPSMADIGEWWSGMQDMTAWSSLSESSARLWGGSIFNDNLKTIPIAQSNKQPANDTCNGKINWYYSKTIIRSYKKIADWYLLKLVIVHNIFSVPTYYFSLMTFKFIFVWDTYKGEYGLIYNIKLIYTSTKIRKPAAESADKLIQGEPIKNPENLRKIKKVMKIW